MIHPLNGICRELGMSVECPLSLDCFNSGPSEQNDTQNKGHKMLSKAVSLFDEKHS